MGDRQLASAMVWGISVALIALGIWALYYDYSYYHVSSISMRELAAIHPTDGNYRITNGTLDFANAMDSKKDDCAVVPIRSRSDPNAPVSVLIAFPWEHASALKKHPKDIELVGQTYEWDIDRPNLKVGYSPHVLGFSTSVREPGLKHGWDIALAFGPIILGTSFILMNAGVGTRTIGSFFRRKIR